MPRKKIIDDTKLTALFRQGKSLKQIGAELSVSHVAVHKRIKRLGLSQLPKSLETLTEKEKGFVIAVAGGQSRINAVMQTYDVTSRESAKALQQALMRDPEIRVAINDLMEIKGIGRDFRIQKMREYMNHQDPMIGLKALDMGIKLSGDDLEAKKQTHVKESHIHIDITEFLYIPSFKKIEGRCPICKLETTENFCKACHEKHPLIIEKIVRFWNGDKCAACNDDQRCFDFCNACKGGV